MNTPNVVHSIFWLSREINQGDTGLQLLEIARATQTIVKDFDKLPGVDTPRVILKDGAINLLWDKFKDDDLTIERVRVTFPYEYKGVETPDNSIYFEEVPYDSNLPTEQLEYHPYSIENLMQALGED